MDLHSNVKASRAIAPAAATTDNTPWVSAILDTQNYDTNELVLQAGVLSDADATFTVLLEESNDSGMSGAVAVADADLIGLESEASFTFADDNVTKKLGYRGNKRYIRATVTPANNTGNAFLAAVWLQANGRKKPAS
ncbi:hypothetical protein [uncultured Reyranella sp.]|uniref:hypothetical protein n=1 Tax=uncultured Reyranella sp. TaxID=735512 RepID=UPI00259D16AE|nr:hypothetical protein [uncultured Reyranella sp.]